MSARAEVLLWAQRIVNRRDATPHVLLEVKQNATMEQIQTAFHDVARTAHPDLHRTTLTADELELVTRAYSRVAGAYQELRSQKMQTTRMEPIRDVPAGSQRPTGSMPPLAPAGSQRPTGSMPPLAPAGSQRPTGSIPPLAAGGEVAAKPSAEMSSKALVYYRKAEQELRRGNLKMAVLQLKLAIASDPQSAFLRSALAEVQSEISKP